MYMYMFMFMFMFMCVYKCVYIYIYMYANPLMYPRFVLESARIVWDRGCVHAILSNLHFKSFH